MADQGQEMYGWTGPMYRTRITVTFGTGYEVVQEGPEALDPSPLKDIIPAVAQSASAPPQRLRPAPVNPEAAAAVARVLSPYMRQPQQKPNGQE